MDLSRRTLLVAGAALPLAAARAAPADPAQLWSTLFAGPPGAAFAWWHQGTLYAHVDRLREFPVAGFHSVMVARSEAVPDGLALAFHMIGFLSDLDTGLPTDRWRNMFTGRAERVPGAFVEGPGRYRMTRGPNGLSLTLASERSRTNRIVATAEDQRGRAVLTQIEGTLQGFPDLDGKLPPLDSPGVTERQTRMQIIGDRGFFTHVYDALPPWLGFGDALGSGLVKGQMRRARSDEVVNRMAWAHLRERLPSAFAGDRLVPA